MKIRDIAEVIERYAPLRLQESYDNAGLIVGRPEDEVHQALLAVDELALADTIRADATFLHPYDRPGEMRPLRMPASRYDVGPQLPALSLAPRVSALIHRHNEPKRTGE